MFALGELVMSLEESASTGVTLTEEHRRLVEDIRVAMTPAFGTTTALRYSNFYGDYREFVEIDRFVPRAESMLSELKYTSQTVAEVYDNDPFVASTLCTLFPGFEYPDFAHLTFDEVRRKYEIERARKLGPSPSANS
jgi:hypothetical protein